MKLSMKYHPAVLSAAIAAASSPAFSANQDTSSMDSNVLGTLEVKDKTYRNTATKTQLDPEETPQAISIIDGEILEERGVESLAEAVRYSSGISTELRGGSVTRLDLFNIRGFDNDTVLLDGLPLLYNGWKQWMELTTAN